MPTERFRLNYSAAFLRQLKRLSKKYRRIRDDLQPMLEQLASGGTPGDQIQGVAHAVYKIRVANRDARRGASGGYRVIYCLQAVHSRLLLAIYSKSEQSDITADEIKRILKTELGG